MTIALPTGASAQITSRAPQHRATSGDPVHEQFIELAASARKNGNHPFGALLVDGTGHVILTAENTALTTHDPTRHAELNLVQLACGTIPPDTLAKATLYTSTEPCIMCCGAIHWARISLVVDGCSAKTLGSIVKSTTLYSLVVKLSGERNSPVFSSSDQYLKQKQSLYIADFGTSGLAARRCGCRHFLRFRWVLG
jgi:tRNA(Arg) A34 adenosine deaminase TadA